MSVRSALRGLLGGVLAVSVLTAAGRVAAQPDEPPEGGPATTAPVGPEATPPQETGPTPGGPPAGPPPQEETPPPPASDLLPPSSAPPARPAAPKRTLYTAAVIQVLDKVTAEGMRFEAPLHKFIRYKGLIFLVNTCQTDASEPPVTAAHIEIDSQPPALPGHAPNAVKMVFRGWMFADMPDVHPFEHPIYDAWLVGCRMAADAPTTH